MRNKKYIESISFMLLPAIVTRESFITDVVTWPFSVRDELMAEESIQECMMKISDGLYVKAINCHDFMSEVRRLIQYTVMVILIQLLSRT